VELALRSKFPGTWGAGLQMEGGWVRGSRNRTMFRAIPEEKFSEQGRGSQREGGSKNLLPNNLPVSGTLLLFQEEVVFE
jgi:hypothetical protein